MEDRQNTNDSPQADTGAGDLKQKVIEAIKTCYDPEIPVDIYELGLIYSVDIKPDGGVEIAMTLTSPACPVAESLPLQVEQKVTAVDGVSRVKVEITWDPPWSTDKMSEAARLTLGM